MMFIYLKPADNYSLHKMIHLARLKHRQMTEIMLKPTSLSLKNNDFKE